jgi:hypothetical protein
LTKIIDEAKDKWKAGKTVKQARDILRSANRKFGRSIVETEKGAVATSAQKIEGNAVRRTLRRLFPEIADALDEEASLLTLRPLLGRARAAGIANPSILPQISLTRPLSMIEGILGQRQIATRLARLGGVAAPEVAEEVGEQAVSRTLRQRLNQLGAPLGELLARRSLGPQLVGGALGEQPQQGLTPDNIITNRLVDQGILPESEREIFPQVGQVQAAETGPTQAQPLLSPGGQWRWDPVANDWVPNEAFSQQAPQAAGMQGITPDFLQQAAIRDLQMTGGKNLSRIKAAQDLLFPQQEQGEAGAQVTQRIARQDLVKAAKSALKTMDKHKGKDVTGFPTTVFRQQREKVGLVSPASVEVRAKLADVGTAFAFGRGGKQFTETELRLIEPLLPFPNEDERVIRNKLKALIETTEEQLGVAPLNPDDLLLQNASMLGGGF